MKKLCGILLLFSAMAFGQISGPATFTESQARFTTDQATSPPPSVTDVTFNHVMQDRPNSLLVVEAVTNSWPGTKVLSVTANGIPMVELPHLKGLAVNRPTDTSVWYLTGLPAGTVVIHATSEHGATNGYGLNAIAFDSYGHDQNNPVVSIDFDNVPPNTVSTSCTVTPTQDGQALFMMEYSTAYNQSSPISASPFPTNLSSGRFSGEQIAVATALNLSAGVSYTETWTSHDSHTSVEWSIIGLLLRPAPTP